MIVCFCLLMLSSYVVAYDRLSLMVVLVHQIYVTHTVLNSHQHRCAEPWFGLTKCRSIRRTGRDRFQSPETMARGGLVFFDVWSRHMYMSGSAQSLVYRDVLWVLSSFSAMYLSRT